VQVCPVDIFGLDSDEQLVIHEDNADECTLCQLCLAVAPAGALSIVKTYTGEALASHGTQGE
jgi:ferredoxin